MAKMYPAQIYSGTSSPGEVEIFHRLRDDPLTKKWLVLHSLDVSHHRSQIAGEIDFVIIVPGKGVLCLEVKAHYKVRRENGLWYFGSDMSVDPRGPFKQASDAMYSIRKRIVKQYPDLSKVVFWSAVIFPFLNFDIFSDEWHPWQVIDRKQFFRASIGELVLNVINNARTFLSQNPNARWFDNTINSPDLGQCDHLCNFLRPDFEFFESPESRANRRNEELRTYTQEQYEALDGMELNDRVIYTGPAGTGKTLLAIEAARRSVGKKRKILFCCYNKLLGTWLRDQIESLLPQENIGTLHSIMLSVAGITPPNNADHEFWEKELPEKAIEKLLLDESGNFKFDELIIDEAQDLLKNSYLDFLDLSLIGGLNSGKWKIFGDFEKQVIYSSSSDEIDSFLKNRFSNIPKYALRANCRNTPRIAELVHLLGGLNPPYSKIRRPDNQVEPKIIPYKKEDQQNEKLVKVLADLLNEGFTESEIIVLSPRSNQDSIASKVSSASFSLCPIRQKHSHVEIGYCTIHSYKGLEAPVIVLTDIDKIETQKSASLFYVAITRSIERLIILVNEQARREMIKKLTKSS
jgi:superfamily I DNA/RNA helicase